MNAGRQANQQRKMKGCVNDEHNLTDAYLPRKCEYSDRVLTSKDRSSIQLVVCDVDENGVINHASQHILPISGFVRQKGNSDYALEVVLKEKGLY